MALPAVSGCGRELHPNRPQCRAQNHACVWCVRPCPGMRAASAGTADAAAWVQCLAVMVALLRHLPSRRALLAGGMSEALWRVVGEGVAPPGLPHAEPLVR
jgi:hypothetical protein